MTIDQIKTKILSLSFVFVATALLGCTVSGEVESGHSASQCVNSRNGEEFSFHHDTVKNVRLGYFGAPTTFEFIDDKGQKRFFSSEMDHYIKCKQI